MRKQDFKSADLKAALERGLGFRIKSLVRLGGGGAINFRAVQDETGGREFIVKCYPSDRTSVCNYLMENLKVLAGSKVPVRVFEDSCPAAFGGYRVVCLSWCPGKPNLSGAFTAKRLKSFLEDYATFSERLQAAGGVKPSWPIRQWRDEVLAEIKGGWRLDPLRRILEAMSEDDLVHRPERMKAIHGDFHPGNTLFVDGRLARIIDLEDLRAGYPTEDLFCYFMNAVRRLSWWEMGQRRRTLANFAEVVRMSPYSAHEWRTAINALFVSKLHNKIKDSQSLGWWSVAKLLDCARLDERCRKIVSNVVVRSDVG